MAQQDEASVEVILESIKKVMERDNRTIAERALRRRKDAAEAADAEGSSETTGEPSEILDLAEMDFAEEIDAEESSETPPLITDKSRDAMQENLAALAMLAEPGAKPQIVRSGETSLEGMTRELLRPMLAEWLENNLPDMVEKMVQAEIARIASKRG